MNAIADQTLMCWLQQCLPPYVSFGDSVDIVSLSAIDIPGPFGTTVTLADTVEEGTFQQINLIFAHSTSMNLVKQKIAEYYRRTGYTVNHVPSCQADAFMLTAENDELDETLTITVLQHSPKEIMVCVA